MMEILSVEQAAMGLAGLSFLAGLAFTAFAAYLFARRKDLRLAGMPAWAPALAAGALLTLILPGALVFLVMYVLVTPITPPPVTCYAPRPPTCYDTAPAAMAGLVLGRGALLERLHEDGKIPGEIYRRLKR